MSAAANLAAKAEDTASIGADITGVLKIGAEIFSLALGMPTGGGPSNPVTGYGQGGQMLPEDL
jgi:hypothetical protein